MKAFFAKFMLSVAILGSQTYAKNFDQKNTKKAIEKVNKILDADLDLGDVIEDWKIDFSSHDFVSSHRINLIDDWALNGTSFVGYMTLGQDDFSRWKSEAIVRELEKGDVADAMQECIFNFTEKSEEKADHFYTYLKETLTKNLVYYRASEAWVFVNSRLFMENHSNCVVAIRDSDHQVILLQYLNLKEDIEF